MKKEIRLNAFDMNCVGHIQHGMWTHPRDRSTDYNTIQYWQDLARLAERGKFDGIFLADIVGVYDVYRGGPAPSIVDAVRIPVNDPMMVVPVMAAVTEHIGLGVTANLTYEPAARPPRTAGRPARVSECGASPQCPTLLSSSATASRRAQQARPHRRAHDVVARAEACR